VRHLLLFDVDSVLVEPTGYLRALQDAVAYFSERLGVGTHPPSEDEVRNCEALGLTSEWDSGAACVAALLVERVAAEPDLQLPDTWPAAVALLAARPHPLPHPDYAALAQRVGALIDADTTTATAARRALSTMVREAHLPPATSAALDTLLHALLGHTHDFYQAPFTRHFQHLAVGSRAIEPTYGVAPDFASSAYLLDYDVPLLSPESRARVNDLAAGGVGVALYTARPSLPPADIPVSARGYSPEAELASELVGMARYPLIGLGSVRWLAEQTGRLVDEFVKPSPVQALAAIGAAAGAAEAESTALHAAYALAIDGALQPPLSDLPATTVHVFEDTVGGIGAVEHAVELLCAAGCVAECRAYGIVTSPGAKGERMAERGIPQFRTVNEALDYL